MNNSDRQTTDKKTTGGKGSDTLSDRELLRRVVMSRYLPMPESKDDSPLLQTSRDIQYRYRDMCTVSVSTVAEVLQELGYTFTFVNNVPYWQLYPMPEDNN